MHDTLNYVFNICILIGFVIPLLNLITGWFGSFLSGGIDIDFDASTDISMDTSVDLNVDTSIDIGGDVDFDTNVGGGGVIPFNIMCLCLFLVVFGALGHMFKRFMTSPLFVALLLFACLVLAGLSYWALYKFVIKRLRQNDASALGYNNLCGKSAEVTLIIRADSLGMISLLDSTGAPISFRAKIDPDLKDRMLTTIQKGESVIITEVDVDNKLCYVSVPFNKLQNNK